MYLPDGKSVRGWSEVGFLAGTVGTFRTCDGVDVRPQEEEYEEDVNKLQQDAWRRSETLRKFPRDKRPSFQEAAMVVVVVQVWNELRAAFILGSDQCKIARHP